LTSDNQTYTITQKPTHIRLNTNSALSHMVLVQGDLYDLFVFSTVSEPLVYTLVARLESKLLSGVEQEFLLERSQGHILAMQLVGASFESLHPHSCHMVSHGCNKFKQGGKHTNWQFELSEKPDCENDDTHIVITCDSIRNWMTTSHDRIHVPCRSKTLVEDTYQNAIQSRMSVCRARHNVGSHRHIVLFQGLHLPCTGNTIYFEQLLRTNA
jgi:hypothetical protein